MANTMNPLACKKCESPSSLLLRWQHFQNGNRHVRVDCLACRKFSHYAPQTPDVVAEADKGKPFNEPVDSTN